MGHHKLLLPEVDVLIRQLNGHTSEVEIVVALVGGWGVLTESIIICTLVSRTKDS